MKWNAILASVGHAIMAGAEKFASSTSGQAVEADVSKTISDGANAAISYVRQGATQQATDAATTLFTKLGLPAPAASFFGQAAVGQGETFLASLIPGV